MRLAAFALAISLASAALAAPAQPTLSGAFEQGGAVIGHGAPRAEVFVDGVDQGRASASGYFVVGLDRDAPTTVRIETVSPAGRTSQTVPVKPVIYDVQRINGLPQDTVTPMGPELLARIKAEAARKAQGFSSRVELDGFKDGFSMPVAEIRKSSRFGGQRILNGEPKTPHYGADLAAPVGTPVTAPADGVVSFAETGLHFEGGLIMIDHGQGFITQYLHLSRVDVHKGQMVRRGQRIGAVGKEGRATGPHLCWRLKWRDRHLDPTLMVGVTRPG